LTFIYIKYFFFQFNFLLDDWSFQWIADKLNIYKKYKR
jgi:hypothetical protein